MENIINEPAPKYNFISQEEYLEMERAALDKHEYYQGEVFAMSGASLRHNRIAVNTLTDLANKLKDKSCQPYGSDMRIHIPKNTLYTYPDISIICEDAELTDDKFDTATNPSVIIELLSKSTRNYDRFEKFSLYREIASLKEYILIDTQRVHVEKHIRNADNSWQLTDYYSLNDMFIISAVNVSVSLADVYAGISF
jgi:Uma2 family endonuclease